MSKKNMNPTDAITLLVRDHREVHDQFEKYLDLDDKSKNSKKRLANEICQALTVHMQIEEKLFYPAARKAIKENDLMDEALVEHAGAKELIAQILVMEPDEDLYDAKVTVLSEQIEHHVEEEESNLFPKVRQSNLDIVALGKAMAIEKRKLEKAGA